MAGPFSQSELEGYLDEALPSELMARIETALRQDPALARSLVSINARRDAGVHSLGEIWRRHRLSCPTRQQVGSYLLDVLDQEFARYVSFHVQTTGCRTCAANLEDLRARESQQDVGVEERRRKYFQSSAGHLPRR